MKIAFLDTYTWDYQVETPYHEPLGGTQSAICYLAESLAQQGHEVFLLNGTTQEGKSRGVLCLGRKVTEQVRQILRSLDAFIIVNIAGKGLEVKPLLGEQTRLILWLHNEPEFIFLQDLKNPLERAVYDGFAFVSDWQRQQFHQHFGIDCKRSSVLRNAIAPCFTNLFPENTPILPQKSQPPILAYASTPFRGLDILLKVFPSIRQAVPGTRLRVFSSMKVHQFPRAEDEAMFGELYRQCYQTEGVEYIGSVPQGELARQLRSSLVFAYPNTYPETASIAVLEAMASGCRVVTSALAALPETTAGFARLIPVSDVKTFASVTNWHCASRLDWQRYTEKFLAETIQVLKSCIATDTAEAEIQLRQQVDRVNRACTWSVRARQWVEWLNCIGVKTVTVAEQMLTKTSVNLEGADAHFLRANQLKAAGQLDAAIDSYKKALNLNSNYPEAYQKLAEVYALKGELEATFACCRQALKIKPDFAPAYLTMGNALQSQEQLEMAIRAYSQAIDIQPDFAEAHANLGSMYYKQNRLSEATACYQKAIAIHPNLVAVHLMLGNVWMQQDQVNQAIVCYQKALEQQPEDAKIYFRLGVALAKVDRIDEAIACCQKVLKLQPNHAEAESQLRELLEVKSQQELIELPLPKRDEREASQVKPEDESGLQPSTFNLPSAGQVAAFSPPSSETNAIQSLVENLQPVAPVVTFTYPPLEQSLAFQNVVEEYRKRAEACLIQGNFKEAISACQQALKIKPDFVWAYMTLGNALQGEGKLEAAIRAYSQGLEFQPNFAEMRANVGSMYFKLGQLQEAIAHYRESINLNPDLAGAHLNLGKAYQQQGQTEEAFACFQRTAELNPQLVGADFHFNLGNNLLTNGKREEAIQCYERALTLKPNWAEVYGNIGSAYSQGGNLDEAIRYYQRAIAIKPELGALYFNLANAFLQRGKYGDAAQSYREALKIKPDWPDVIANLANALAMEGHLTEALETYQKSLEFKPDWPEVYCRMGHIEKQEKPLDAIVHFEKAIQLKPDYSEAYQQLCDLLSHSSNLAGARSIADRYCQHCGNASPVMTGTAYVFSYLQSGVSQEALAKLEEVEKLCYHNVEHFNVIELKLLYEIFLFAASHLRDSLEGNANFYRLVAKEYYKKTISQEPPAKKRQSAPYFSPQKDLRIGFLSKHFRRHSVGWCSEALIRELTYITPHVHLYVTGKLNRDEVTERFEQMAGKFYWPKKYPNGFADGRELLEEVVQDNLDVLIDLDSMTVPTNVEVLYHDAAPICVSWLGFDAPYMSSNHYFLCDWHTHPAGIEKHYIEQLIRLPHGSVAIGALESVVVDRNAIRQTLGIGLDQLTYLCVAPGRKTNPEMVRAQVQILKHVPDSLLIRKGQGDADVIKQTYSEECRIQGVDINRIRFIGQTKTEEEHRAIYHIADVLLDSYPYNGGTHNLEALWANLPVVTRAGEQYLSRMGYAFLKSANLDVGIGWTWEEYTQWGIKFGQDANFRNAVRHHLMQSKQPEHLAPLWNPQQLAKDMYQGFQELLMKQRSA
ncbi:MAG: tetratricopeptide repeat protein [Actinomycetota bacterium]